MYLQIIVCMFGRPEPSRSSGYRSRMCLHLILDVYKVLGRGFDEKKERKAADGFFPGHIGRFQPVRLEKKDTVLALNV